MSIFKKKDTTIERITNDVGTAAKNGAMMGVSLASAGAVFYGSKSLFKKSTNFFQKQAQKAQARREAKSPNDQEA